MVRGLVLGKFLPYHTGHAHLIRTARRAVDELTVLVCSLPHEPIPGTLRHDWVREAHPDCRVVHVAEEVPQAPDESSEFWPIWAELIARYAGPVDTVFTSEEYGDELAERLGAVHNCVDVTRSTVPISATAIRAAPLEHWDFIPPVERPYYVQRVAILGPESTGKSTLAVQLANEFATRCVVEYGREYCARRNALTLTSADFDAIGIGQIELEEQGARKANRLLICDTDLVTTCTWSDMVIGERPEWLEHAAAKQQYALTLVLSDQGVPWVDDGTRVLEARRTEHLERIITELQRLGRPFHLLEGSWSERSATARRLVARVAARQ